MILKIYITTVVISFLLILIMINHLLKIVSKKLELDDVSFFGMLKVTPAFIQVVILSLFPLFNITFALFLIFYDSNKLSEMVIKKLLE